MQNYVNIYEHQTGPNPALAAVHDQAALLLCYDVPTYYVSRELLAAALRTDSFLLQSLRKGASPGGSSCRP